MRHDVPTARAADDASRIAGVTVSEADANKLIVNAVRAVGGSIPGIAFKTSRPLADIPASIQDAATDKDTGKVPMVNGIVYVILDAHQPQKEIEKTVFH